MHESEVNAVRHLRALHGWIREQFDSSVPPIGRRGLPDTVNGALASAILRHRHFLLRVENGALKNLLGPLEDARTDILGQIARLAAQDDALDDLARMNRARLIALNRRIEETIQDAEGLIIGRAADDFRAIAASEIEIQNRLLRRHVPNGISLDLVGPDVLRVEALINQPLGGERWASRIARDLDQVSTEARRSLATSVALGEGMDQAAARLGLAVDKFGRNRLIAITRSEIQRVANTTAVETYRQNRSVIKGVQIYETLDRRTCLICADKDGTVLSLDASGLELPPFHTMCRGFTSPVTRSFEEMGIDAREFSPSTRASMDGQVAGTITYRDWFATQPESFQRQVLGPARFQAFSSGDLELSQMVKDLRILPLSELPTLSLGPN